MKLLGELPDVMTRGLDIVIKSLFGVACVALSIMVLLVAGNVVMRYIFNKPLAGSVELIEMLMIIIAFFVMPYTAIKGDHVRINLITSRLSKRTKAIMGSIAFFLSTVILAIIFYQSSLSAIFYIHHPERATTVLSIPFAPFRVVIAVGFLLLCLALFRLVFNVYPPAERSNKD
jgi:TRAP-type C4-dicarboxylate transport system permease small subunit